MVDPGDDKHGKIVYFDVLGLFSVAYPERMGLILNYGTIILTIIGFLVGTRRLEKEGEIINIFFIFLSLPTLFSMWQSYFYFQVYLYNTPITNSWYYISYLYWYCHYYYETNSFFLCTTFNCHTSLLYTIYIRNSTCTLLVEKQGVLYSNLVLSQCLVFSIHYIMVNRWSRL